MPHVCAARFCNNNSRRKPDGISFHSLPIKDENLLKIWLFRMRRNPANFKPSKHSKICSDHFLPTDYCYVDSKTVRPRLDKHAIPSVFAWTNTTSYEVVKQNVHKSDQINVAKIGFEEVTENVSGPQGGGFQRSRLLMKQLHYDTNVEIKQKEIERPFDYDYSPSVVQDVNVDKLKVTRIDLEPDFDYA